MSSPPQPLYSDNLTDTQTFCEHNALINCSSNDIDQASLDTKLMQLIPKIDKLMELIKFTKLHASKRYREIEMSNEYLLDALENPNNGLFLLYIFYQASRGEQDINYLDQKEKFSRNIWNQCNDAFKAPRRRDRDENKMRDENGNWILKKHEITLSDLNESAPYSQSETVAVIANHRGFFDMRIIEQDEGEREDKIEDLEKELKESAKRRNKNTGYQEIYPSGLYTLANSQDNSRFLKLNVLLQMVNKLIDSVNEMLKGIPPTELSRLNNKGEYKPINKIDLVRIIWDKCNSAFLEGKGVYEEKTKYWLLDQHEIELPFMIDNELFTKLTVSAIAKPETDYFHFRLALPGEEIKQDLAEWLDISERLRSTQSGWPSAPQSLA